jgi:hypothetical protein
MYLKTTRPGLFSNTPVIWHQTMKSSVFRCSVQVPLDSGNFGTTNISAQDLPSTHAFLGVQEMHLGVDTLWAMGTIGLLTIHQPFYSQNNFAINYTSYTIFSILFAPKFRSWHIILGRPSMMCFTYIYFWSKWRDNIRYAWKKWV